MTHLLRFTPPASDGIGKFHAVQGPFYFVSLGDPWPSRPDLRLIAATTRDKTKARSFASIAEASETLALCGEPEGWELEVVE